MRLILGSEECSVHVAALVREWQSVENLKREWRGIPRLSPASLREILDAKRTAMKSARTAPTFVEIPDEPGKESLSGQTVPTPPAPEAPRVVSDL